MLIIDQNGFYAYKPGTKTLSSSNNPAYRARVEVGLGVGTWLYAPARGHNLARFNRARQTLANVEEYRKELIQYLSAYSPEQVQEAISREDVTVNVTIPPEVTSG